MTSVFDLHGKTTIITWASSGLGVQFARVLSATGTRVILASRRDDKLEDLGCELGNARTNQMDVSDKESMTRCFAELGKAGEKIDIYLNNAGIAALTPSFEVDDKGNFESIIQTNMMRGWYVTKEVANHMKHHSIHGSIINIGSVNGDAIPAKSGTAYCISKAAVIHLTKTLVGELSPNKIRITCISPGWIRTPMNGPDVEQIIPLIPYGDIAEASDLDGLILYLASNDASKYVTESTFTIDGGMSWGGRVC